MKSFFITGTDTDVGKTAVTALLMRTLSAHIPRLVGFKPIAAGAEVNNQGQLRNDDALTLQAASSVPLAYEQVNPICFVPPIAPHIAAHMAGQPIDTQVLDQQLMQFDDLALDVLFVEGAGGWKLPISLTSTLDQWVAQHSMDVILVVGLKLGCLNHALLTYQAIQASGCRCVGWVGNAIDSDMLVQQDNIKTLMHMIDAPCVGLVPYLDDLHTGHILDSRLNRDTIDALLPVTNAYIDRGFFNAKSSVC